MTTTTTSNKLSSDEILAQFNLDVNRRGYEMQKTRSGLLSTPDAVRVAVFEQFSQGFLAIKNAIDYTKLLGGEGKEEQIQAMKDFVSASSGSTKEANDIVQNMLDKFSTEYQIQHPAPIPTVEEQILGTDNNKSTDVIAEKKGEDKEEPPEKEGQPRQCDE